jgi:hypothetical protein
MKEMEMSKKVAMSLGAVVAAIGSLVSIAANIFDSVPGSFFYQLHCGDEQDVVR